MTPCLPYSVDEGDGSNDHELDNNDNLVIVNKSHLPDRPSQSYTSDLSKTTSTQSKVQTFERPPRSSRSTSPQKGSASGPLLRSVPAVETVQLPSKVTVVSCTSPELRKALLKEQLREDELESRSQDDSDKLDTVLSHPHYQQLQRDLEEESSRRKQFEDELIEKDTRLAEIRTKSESELIEKNKELDEMRKGWRKLAGELNKIRAKGQGFYQVTDAYLTDKTKSLRYSIRNFAIQYFDGEMKHNVEIKDVDFLERYVKPTTPLQPKAYVELFASPTRCSSLIQGILWRVLTGRVFNQFRWAGKVADDVWCLHQTLSPTSPDTRPNSEAERRFQTWSAMTTNLLLDELDLKEGGDAYERLEKRKRLIQDDISGAIQPFARNMDRGFEQELIKIIRDAIALDLELSRQVARVIWVYDWGEYDSSTMVLKEGESLQAGKRDVHLIVAPGLKKRGKSTGEDFKMETSLLPMEVSCVPVPTRVERSSFRRLIG